MKKILYISTISLLLLPKISFAETVTTNQNNIPLQIENNNPRVVMLIPNFTPLNKVSSYGEFYSVTYDGMSGSINRDYTTEGKIEKEQQQQATSSNSNSSDASYKKDVENISSSEKMDRIVNAANKYGQKYNLDPLLILALIQTESSFNPKAHSAVNCRGLMQISYRYAESWGIDKTRLYEIEYNIENGTRILKNVFIKGMGGDVYDGLRAYNQGVNAAKSSSIKGKTYANKIMRYYKYYKENGFNY